MRFYFGFSKKIPIKWIITAILAILAFFGISKVHALEITDLNYVRQVSIDNSLIDDSITNSRIFTFQTPFTPSDYDYAVYP